MATEQFAETLSNFLHNTADGWSHRCFVMKRRMALGELSALDYEGETAGWMLSLFGSQYKSFLENITSLDLDDLESLKALVESDLRSMYKHCATIPHFYVPFRNQAFSLLKTILKVMKGKS